MKPTPIDRIKKSICEALAPRSLMMLCSRRALRSRWSSGASGLLRRTLSAQPAVAVEQLLHRARAHDAGSLWYRLGATASTCHSERAWLRANESALDPLRTR